VATIFISHSSRDNELTRSLQSWLTTNGFDDLFVDFSNIRGGDQWPEALRRAKGACRIVLCVVTESWLASDDCFGEFTAAFYMGKRIVPLFALAGPVTDERRRSRFARVRAEDQGFDISQGISNGALDLDTLPLIADPFKAGLRAGGALVKVGLDPAAFEIDRAIRPSPFPGLESFGDEDADAAIFFGRSPEIEHCLEELREMRANGVPQPYGILGASGSGKSSLMKAGIIPRLRRERGWLPLRTFRPGADPLMNFAESIARTLADFGETQGAGSIRDALLDIWRNLRADRFVAPSGRLAIRAHLESYFSRLRLRADRPLATVLIPLDQAEELVRAEGEGADALSDYLRAAYADATHEPESAPQVSAIMVTFTIRSDSFAELQKSARFAGLDARCADIRPMPLYRFDTAIECPAERYGVQIDPALVEAIIDDAPGDDALPLLAFALQRLWEQYHSELRLQKSHYERLGTLGPLIDDAAERALRGFSPGNDEPLRPMLPTGTERLAAKIFIPPLAQISDTGAAIRRVAPTARFNADANRLIDWFVRWRILVQKLGADPLASTIEVAHEAIFRSWVRLQRWIEQEKVRMQALRDLEIAARHWDRKNRNSAYLDHRGRRLKEAMALLEIPEFAAEVNDTQKSYLKTCLSVQRKQRALSATAAFALLLIFFTIGGYIESALMRADMGATADRLIRTGLPLRAGKFAVAGTLGDKDVSRLFGVWDAEDSLRDTGFTLKMIFGLDEEFIADKYRFSGDGTRLLTKTADGAGAIWDVDSGKRLADLGGNGSVKAFAVLQDDTRVVTQSNDNAIAIWNMRTGARLGGSGSAAYATGFLTTNPPRMVTLSESGTAVLWNVDSGELIATLGEPNEVDSLTIIANPPRVIIHSRKKAGTLWDSTTGSKIVDMGGDGSCEQCGFSTGGSRLISISSEGSGLLLDAQDGRRIGAGLIDPGARIAGYAFSSDGRRLITRSIYNRLTLWDAEAATRIAEVGVSDGQNYAFSPSGQQFILRSTNSSGELHASPDGSLLARFGSGDLATYKFSNEGDRLATSTLALAASLWNSRTGIKIVDLAEPGVADNLKFSSDGSRLSVGSASKIGALWDSERGIKLTDYDRPAVDSGGGGFSKDGIRFVTSGSDNFGILWDARTGQYLANVGGEGAVDDAELSDDGQKVVTNSVSSTVAVWDGENVPKTFHKGELKSYVCAINYDSIRPFSPEMRAGNERIGNVEIGVSFHLRGRPWHPCDWQGLQSLEGWAQMFRFWMVKLGLPWDYRCGERGVFADAAETAAKICEKK
jgi:WD40 repeat protein